MRPFSGPRTTCDAVELVEELSCSGGNDAGTPAVVGVLVQDLRCRALKI